MSARTTPEQAVRDIIVGAWCRGRSPSEEAPMPASWTRGIATHDDRAQAALREARAAALEEAAADMLRESLRWSLGSTPSKAAHDWLRARAEKERAR